MKEAFKADTKNSIPLREHLRSITDIQEVVHEYRAGGHQMRRQLRSQGGHHHHGQRVLPVPQQQLLQALDVRVCICMCVFRG